jgi:hypothetical protein
MPISDIRELAMMLKPRTLLSVLVLFLSSPVLAQSVAAPYTSGTRYDIAGRVTGTISSSASGTQGPFLATRNSYDASGNLSSVEEGQLASWQDDSIPSANWVYFTPARTTFMDGSSARRCAWIPHNGVVNPTRACRKPTDPTAPTG